MAVARDRTPYVVRAAWPGVVDPEALFIDLPEIEAAAERIQGIAYRTPLVPADRHEQAIHLKLETLQRTGSFKLRGAWNRMSRLSDEEQAAGFVTVSAGNHGQAVAWCAQRMGAPCTVWVPDDAVARKIAAMEAMGARIERLPHEEIMQGMEEGRWEGGPATYIHPFAHPHTVAGTGTIGLEVLADLPEVRTVLVPVGGGGLAAGVATAVKAHDPSIRVLGVQAEGAAPLPASLEAGKPVHIGTPRTIADGMAASMVFADTWPVLRERLDGAVRVSDQELRAAIHHLAIESHVVAEGAGAAALAAAWRYQDELEAPIACIVSGGNIDVGLLAEIVAGA